MFDSVIIQTSTPICSIMCFEVKPEWLFIASEICPSGIIHCHVRFSSYKVRYRLVAVESEHFSNFCIYSICCIVPYNQIFRIQELSHCEITPHVSDDIDCFYCCGIVTGPFDMNLYRQPWGRLYHQRGWIQPIDMSSENRRILSV